MTANKPYSLAEQYHNEWNELDKRVQIIKSRGKFTTSLEIVIYIKWRYGKGQSWVYRNLMDKIVWHYTQVNKETTVRYIPYSDLRKQVEKIMG